MSPSRFLRSLCWVGCLFFGSAAALSAALQPAQEEDGVILQDPSLGSGARPIRRPENGPGQQSRSSGSWFLSVGTGTAFPQYDRGEIVNDRTGAIEPISGDINFAVNSTVSVGYRWFDPDRWGHWSFDADFFGSYLGGGISSPAGSSQDNLGFLGIRGRVGYRVFHDRIEPFLGIIGGSVLANSESAGVDHGSVWGWWFSPTTGVRYYIPNTRWSIAFDAFFRFIGGINGLSAPGVTINETPHAGLSGHFLYEPVGILSIGYRF